MLADKLNELSRIKLKTWTRQPVPMISEHSAHLTALSVDFRTWLWQYTYLLLLSSMLWHRQAIFKSKGDKLCSSVECRIGTRGPKHKWPADWMLADKSTELSRIKLKTWTRQAVPMISEHSAHLTPLSVDFRTWLWWYTYLLSISMLGHRQAIFKSKGDKLCSSAECRIGTRGPRHQIASRLNACWQTDWAIEDQAKNLNSTAHPYDQRAFSPLDPTVSWHSHLALAITYLLFLISMLWHRPAIFKSKGDKLCPSAECRIGTRGPRHHIASRLNARWQTDWAIEYQAKNLNSTARPYDQRAFRPLDPTANWLSHLSLAIYIFFVVNFDALAKASDIQIERRQVVFLCWMQDLHPGSQTPNHQQTECSLTNWLSYRGSS